MKLSIIIPTKDRIEILQRTIDNLIGATSELDVEIIIVNDSQTPINLKQNNKNILILNNVGSGAASARNTGVKQSTGGLLLFLDDDILVNKGNILKTLLLHQNNPHSAFIFFWLYPPELIEILPNSSFGRYALNHMLFSNSHRIKINEGINKLIKTEGLTSQYFSISKLAFLLTEGYDEKIPHAGIEDYVLYKELKKNKIDVFISPSDVIFQNESDRISLFSVMERYRRGAITIQKAREIGHLDISVSFSKTKKIIYSLLVHLKPIIYKITMQLPNRRMMDFLYFKLTNLLLGLSQYEGYYSKKEVKN